jgi:hypothetical protein
MLPSPEGEQLSTDPFLGPLCNPRRIASSKLDSRQVRGSCRPETPAHAAAPENVNGEEAVGLIFRNEGYLSAAR